MTTPPRRSGNQSLIISNTPPQTPPANTSARPGIHGQPLRSGLSGSGPAVPPPAKKGTPLRYKLFWAGVAAAALWLIGQFKGEPPYMHTTPNRDVPADVFKRPDSSMSQVTPQPIQRQTQRPQTYTPAPVQEAPAETESAAYPNQAERISAGQAVLQAFYNEHPHISGGMHNNMQNQLSRRLSQVSVDQAVYVDAGVASTHERTYIAMAAARPGNVAYAFVCAQQKTTITALSHVAVKPNSDGTFEVAVNDKFNHSTRGNKPDYMTGLDLMTSYGKFKHCDRALRELNDDAHGTAELEAIPVTVRSTKPYQYDWHK